MAEGTEVEDRVDLDDDNYMEEMDDDVEEPIEDGVEGGGDEDVEEEYENSKARGSEEDQLLEVDKSHIANEALKDEEHPTASINEDDIEKHAQLLALPPHGSEIFIGGLPREALEEDLRDLCEPIGEVFEVKAVMCMTFTCWRFSIQFQFHNYFAGKADEK